uniref:Uncharacterized protein n=1 Tax=Rhizophora mucronata TaxID=61149 RepID=A0A2P2R2J2_RHIMU
MKVCAAYTILNAMNFLISLSVMNIYCD